MNSWIVLFMLVMSGFMYQYLGSLERKVRVTPLWEHARSLNGCRVVLAIFCVTFFIVLMDRHAYDLYNMGNGL